jgi:hypothetical protein
VFLAISTGSAQGFTGALIAVSVIICALIARAKNRPVLFGAFFGLLVPGLSIIVMCVVKKGSTKGRKAGVKHVD